jgi:predicted extracellular nuclease
MQRALSAVLLALIGLCTASVSHAGTAGVVISQIHGANGNAYASDYVELFNAGATPVDIGGWSVQYASATGSGNFAGNGVSVLSGTLQPGQYFLVALAGSASGAPLPTPYALGAPTNLSASNGKVALVRSATGLACNGGSSPCSAAQSDLIADLVGYGNANAFEGTPAPGLTSGTALFRKLGGCADGEDNGADFTTGTPSPRNTASPLAPCGTAAAPIVPVCPAGLSIALGAEVPFTLRATDSDGIVDRVAFAVMPPAGLVLGPLQPASAPGGAASVELATKPALSPGNHSVTVVFGNTEGRSGSCSIALAVLVPPAVWTPIPTLQGTGRVTALPGLRTTRGVVTRINDNGYFLQDAAGDGDPATSDGIFVFTGAQGPAGLRAGHALQITGTLGEYDPAAGANAVTAANPVTQFTAVTSTIFTGTGAIVPTVLALPIAAAEDFERHEGMLVAIPTPLAASQNFFLGRYGQMTLAAEGRLIKPTQLHRPGSPEALGRASLNARSLILLDDGRSAQNPAPVPYIGPDDTLRAGDVLPAGLTGVIDYGLATNSAGGPAAYRIHPTSGVQFQRVNARPATPPPLGGTHRVAAFNVLNYFTTFRNGTTASGATGQGCLPSGTTGDCRGADNAVEFQRQRAKIVEAVVGLGADVVGLMEIQRNGNVAAQDLVDGLNAKFGPGSYAVAPEPPGGVGTDAIRLALIYRPAALSLAGPGMSDASPIHDRPPIAQTFVTKAGARFSVIVNHFKSKNCGGASGADADQGDGQGCFNARRISQANALLGFVGAVAAASGDPDVLVIGDLNAYGSEDPLETLRNGGLVDLDRRFSGTATYSYVFDGESGTLDHALATPALSAQVTGAAHWRINADEPSVIDYNTEFKTQDLYTPTPYRASDHDPILVGLNVAVAPLAQNIVFASLPDRRLDQSPFPVTATASSGLAVTFRTTTPMVCSVTGSMVSLSGTGTCSLWADQAGDPIHGPAPSVARSFAVATGMAQTIDFPPLTPRGVGSGDFAPTVSASSGLPVLLGSSTPTVCTTQSAQVGLIGIGTCTLSAQQPGNAVWLPATPVTRSFAVTGALPAPAEEDVPLPAWALGLMATALAAALRRRARP